MSNISESLSEKLRSLGVQSGPGKQLQTTRKNLGIENVVEGTYKETNHGSVFCSEISTYNGYAHGSVHFLLEPINPQLIHWADPSFSDNDLSLESILFLDTETTGLSGGTGTLPFMIGVGRFWGNVFTTFQVFLRNPAEERAQLEVLDQFLAGVKSIATYNGKGFDIPILKTRYILNNHPSPLDNLAHFDLLPLSRRIWKRRLDNRSLKDIETEILGFHRSQMEVPGWEVPLLYFDYLRNGDPEPMKGVFYHNAIDIQSLAALFLYMNRMISDVDRNQDILPIDLLSLAIQHESSGQLEKAISLYERLLGYELPKQYENELRLRYARIMKRNGDFLKAQAILDSNERNMDIHRMIQLAKVLEHQKIDAKSALEWTEIAISQMDDMVDVNSSIIIQRLKSDLVKRRNRLLRKLGKND